MIIETAANLGDRAFFLRKKTRSACPLCEGAGTVTLNGKQYLCPECKGKKTVKLDVAEYEVAPCTVGGISALNGVDQTHTYYTLFDDNGKDHYTATEENLLTDEAEANRRCRIQNLKCVNVPITEIHIPYAFLMTLPCNEKLCKRLDEYRASGTMTAEICLSENGVLFDGYTSFLIYRLLGKTELPVTYWPDDLLDQKARGLVKNYKHMNNIIYT